jgi:hypothetical protein
MRKVFLLVLGIFFISCLPESKYPLSSPDSAVLDKDLQGVWVSSNNKETAEYGYLHIVPRQDNTSDIVVVSHSKDSGAETGFYVMFTTIIEGNRYMNLKEKDPKTGKLSGDYIFAKYEIFRNEVLILRLMTNDDMLIKAIESGQLKGKISKGRLFTTVTITDVSSKVAEFITDNNQDRLFGESVYFRKVR